MGTMNGATSSVLLLFVLTQACLALQITPRAEVDEDGCITQVVLVEEESDMPVKSKLWSDEETVDSLIQHNFYNCTSHAFGAYENTLDSTSFNWKWSHTSFYFVFILGYLRRGAPVSSPSAADLYADDDHKVQDN